MRAPETLSVLAGKWHARHATERRLTVKRQLTAGACASPAWEICWRASRWASRIRKFPPCYTSRQVHVVGLALLSSESRSEAHRSVLTSGYTFQPRITKCPICDVTSCGRACRSIFAGLLTGVSFWWKDHRDRRDLAKSRQAFLTQLGDEISIIETWVKAYDLVTPPDARPEGTLERSSI